MSNTNHFFYDQGSAPSHPRTSAPSNLPSHPRTLAPSHPFQGLRVAITGGTAGLGHALVRQLLQQGAQVAFVARDRGRVERVQREFPTAIGFAGDVSHKDDIYPLALQILGTLGGLDVLINNASSLGPEALAPLADTSCEDLEHALATNLVGPFRLTQALLGALAASARDGRPALVVNISSDAASNAYPNWGAYGASKAALQHLTRIWDEEMRDSGVRFVALDPGDMDTALHAQAVPDADPATLKRPDDAAGELLEKLARALVAA
jgi:NAD(P)-dependent dehydrogenase (short-subunit alcohol dehydrogenase family)